MRRHPGSPPACSRARLWGGVLLLVLVLAFGGGEAAAGRVDLLGVRVRWDAGLDDLGRQAAAVLPGVREEVARRLGWAYEGPSVDVAIVSGHDRMCEEARVHLPTWAVGAALPAQARIVIRSDLLAAGYGGGIQPVLRHEWVHLSWGWRAGPHRRLLPLWVEEGLAEEVGGAVSVDAGAALDWAAAFHRLLVFEDLRSAFPEDARGADLAYKQSRSWVRYVTGRVGWEAFRGVLEDLAAGRGGETPGEAFATALRVRTGEALGSWHVAWRVALEEEASPWYQLLLRDFHGALIAGLAVVGAGAFVLVRRRRRRQLAQLPDEPLPEDFLADGVMPADPPPERPIARP